MIAFLVYGLIFCAFFVAHFYYAWLAWRELRGVRTAEIDQGYVRIENYFGQSFRRKVAEWLKLPDAADSTSYLRTICKGNELVLVFGAARSPDGSRADEILVVEGDFSCGRDSYFAREILVRRNCQIGRGTHLQAIAADGNLSLGSGVHVVRWADSMGDMELRSGSKVRARASSASEIRVAANVEAGVLYSPRVVILPEAPPRPLPPGPPAQRLELPPPVANRGESGSRQYGFEPNRLLRLSEDSWIYDGDLKLDAPLYLRSKLIVRGNCTLPAGSWIEQDLKAAGDLNVGPSSVLIGNLISGGRMTIGPNSLFQGVVHSGKTLRICQGTRGYREGARVVAFSAEQLTVESNVVVSGKLASGDKVLVVPTDPAPLQASRVRNIDEARMASRQQ